MKSGDFVLHFPELADVIDLLQKALFYVMSQLYLILDRLSKRSLSFFESARHGIYLGGESPLWGYTSTNH